MDISDFKSFIINRVRGRRAGRIAEIMIEKIYGYSTSLSVDYDLSFNKERIEVKSSVVRHKHKNTINENNLLKCIEISQLENREVDYSNWYDYIFDCNIQQIKRSEFDILFYVLFFNDCILIFKILSIDILEKKDGGVIGYCNKQHKGNLGEGQFHITNKNLQIHIDNFLIKTLTWEELQILLIDVK